MKHLALVLFLVTRCTGQTAAAWRGDLNGVWLGPYTPDLTSGTAAELTPWGKAAFAAFTGTAHPCLPPGVSRLLNTGDPIEIVQTPQRVVILYEAWAAFRSIPMNGREHPHDLDPTWLGNSIGRWEGDTLEIDVTAINDKNPLDAAGHPHSGKLHLIERFRRTGPTTMAYEVIVDDPVAYTVAWKQSRTFELKPGWELLEYVCLENERDRVHFVGANK